MNVGWTDEIVFHEGDQFFKAMQREILHAGQRIDMDYYIFADDSLGQLIFSKLEAAASRGIKVRLIVDGVGSSRWRESYETRAVKAGIEYHVYHELPLEQIMHFENWPAFHKRATKLLKKANRRDHHKICLIDGHTLFTGSFNISSNHAREYACAECWRDTGVRLEGPATKAAQDLFETIWKHRAQGLWKLRRLSKWVSTNHTRALRIQTRKELCRQIATARERVWITTPYFAPDMRLIKALKQAAIRTKDVKLLLPSRSDVTWAPLLSRIYFRELLESGIKIYLYQPSILHAKIMIADDWVVVGSTNLNHRSLIHDLEFDVRLKTPQSHQKIKAQYLVDLKCSIEITSKSFEDDPQWKKWAGQALFKFRNFM